MTAYDAEKELIKQIEPIAKHLLDFMLRNDVIWDDEALEPVRVLVIENSVYKDKLRFDRFLYRYYPDEQMPINRLWAYIQQIFISMSVPLSYHYDMVGELQGYYIGNDKTFVKSVKRHHTANTTRLQNEVSRIESIVKLYDFTDDEARQDFLAHANTIHDTRNLLVARGLPQQLDLFTYALIESKTGVNHD